MDVTQRCDQMHMQQHALQPVGDKTFNLLSPRCDKHIFSPYNIITSFREEVMRIKRSDHQRENALIIQLNSLNQFFKEMYLDQSGEITCEH